MASGSPIFSCCSASGCSVAYNARDGALRNQIADELAHNIDKARRSELVAITLSASRRNVDRVRFPGFVDRLLDCHHVTDAIFVAGNAGVEHSHGVVAIDHYDLGEWRAAWSRLTQAHLINGCDVRPAYDLRGWLWYALQPRKRFYDLTLNERVLVRGEFAAAWTDTLHALCSTRTAAAIITGAQVSLIQRSVSPAINYPASPNAAPTSSQAHQRACNTCGLPLDLFTPTGRRTRTDALRHQDCSNRARVRQSRERERDLRLMTDKGRW